MGGGLELGLACSVDDGEDMIQAGRGMICVVWLHEWVIYLASEALW